MPVRKVEVEMRCVLTYCAECASWNGAVRYAAELAANLDALLTGIHVSLPLPSRMPEGLPESVRMEFIAYAQNEVHSAMAAGPSFNQWARERGVASAYWQVAIGDPAAALCAAGNWNDVLVIGCNQQGTDRSEKLICEILHSGLACLVVPEQAHAVGRIENVAVAWDDSPSSTRALHAAMPMMHRTRQALVIDGTSPARGGAGTHGNPEFDPVRHLRQHGINADSERFSCADQETGESLLRIASRSRADLLVVGASVRKSLGELRIGETTRNLLQYTCIPLLMLI
jgi:nucleotide-binding universal stress UspA family protein